MKPKLFLTILLVISIAYNIYFYKKYKFETGFRDFYVWAADNHPGIYRSYFEPDENLEPVP